MPRVPVRLHHPTQDFKLHQHGRSPGSIRLYASAHPQRAGRHIRSISSGGCDRLGESCNASCERFEVTLRVEWPLFDQLPPEDVRRVIASARRRTFARNEVIFHEGDPADSVLMVAKGRVIVRTTTPLGHIAALSVLPTGAFVGEMALLGGPAVRSATAIALEPVEALALHTEAFAQLRGTHPSVTEILVTLLAETVRRLNQQLLEALYVPADTRTRRRVIELMETYGDATIPLTQEDLAGLAGTTRATVNRVLRDEEKRGTLKLSRGKITVTDAAALAKRA